MKTHKAMACLLLLATGFVGGWWCASTVLAAPHEAPAAGSAVDDTTPRLLERCDARLRLLRVQLFEVERDQQQMLLEGRIGARSPTGPDQQRRLQEGEAKARTQAAAIQREIAELVDLADKLRDLIATEVEASTPPPEWLHEARIRLRLRALDESK
jgi:hypothetical protein